MSGFSQMFEMAASLRAFSVASRPLLVGLLDDMAADMERYAKDRAPVRTGLLRSSVEASPVIVRGANGMLVHLEATAPYAQFVEYGTSRMAPQPFLEPAAEWGAEQFDGIVDIALGEL